MTPSGKPISEVILPVHVFSDDTLCFELLVSEDVVRHSDIRKDEVNPVTVSV